MVIKFVNDILSFLSINCKQIKDQTRGPRRGERLPISIAAARAGQEVAKGAQARKEGGQAKAPPAFAHPLLAGVGLVAGTPVGQVRAPRPGRAFGPG